ncbi:MAG: pyridoxal-dependent decarboxylase, exosortase A system-associated [Bdellovibrionaceae bacterium]|nr:pyridoxal-dependent decarboxylase, exosortase A system-associated [Pseudobdellovibrionaceae bacterium]
MIHSYFDLSQDEVLVQGRKISEWAAAGKGGTPFYLYHSVVIEKKIQELRKNLPKEIQIHYAVKANPMPELVSFMAGWVNGFDVASTRELQLVIGSGMPAKEISFAGPGKTDDELTLAISEQVLIYAESIHEIRRIAGLSKRLNTPARLGLRINPQFDMKSSGLRMGGGSKAFGIDSEQVPEVCVEVATLGLEIEGVHIFAGSQNLDAQTICQTIRLSFALVKSMSSLFLNSLRVFNFGGGLGIPYFENDKAVDVVAIGKTLFQEVPDFLRVYPRAVPVIELGRFLVGECGLFVSRIVDIKISRGQKFLVLDGGMNCHLAATGNLGQVIKRNFPLCVGNRLQSSVREVVNVVGPLCTPLDTFATQVELTLSEVGDLVVIFQSGAYGLTASPSQFLSQRVAREIFI